MKKIATIIFTLTAIFMLSSCNKKTADAKIKIVTTIFPEYDWVQNILGEKAGQADLTLLLDKGVDLHSYQPTVQDMAKLSVADIFIYVGGESDEWVEDALKTVKNKHMRVVNLLEVLGDKVKEEEVVEGMEGEHHHDDHHEGEEHDADEHHHDEEEAEYDEHVWLSLKNARLLCAAITETLCAVDEKNAATYRANLASYDKTLAALDSQYADAVKNAPLKTLVFGDRFPFRYLVDDYGISYYAAFAGCSAETEASFKTVAFLAAKVDELALPAVCKIESGDGKIAGTIIQNSKAKQAKVLTLNSLQSASSRDLSDGTSYIGIMQENLSVLKEALGTL